MSRILYIFLESKRKVLYFYGTFLQRASKLFPLKLYKRETSLVVQWLRIWLPLQEIWVRSLVGEDPTCCGATKPILHNY